MAKKYNCIKNGKPYFRKTKVVGHKANGKPIVKEFYGDGEKDADRQIEEYMQKLKNGLNLNVEKMTVQEGMHQWLFDVLLPSKNKKSASFDKHECNYRNYIKDKNIGFIVIQNAVSLPFQQYYNEIYKKGVDYIDTKTGKGKHSDVSEDKIFDLNKTLRAFFNYCVKQKYTLDNPCSLENIDLPGNADGEEDETDEEGNDIQAFSDNDMEIIRNNLRYKEGKDNTLNVALQFDFITRITSWRIIRNEKKVCIKIYG